jgi:hypothetical protein
MHIGARRIAGANQSVQDRGELSAAPRNGALRRTPIPGGDKVGADHAFADFALPNVSKTRRVVLLDRSYLSKSGRQPADAHRHFIKTNDYYQRSCVGVYAVNGRSRYHSPMVLSALWISGRRIGQSVMPIIAHGGCAFTASPFTTSFIPRALPSFAYRIYQMVSGNHFTLSPGITAL